MCKTIKNKGEQGKTLKGGLFQESVLSHDSIFTASVQAVYEDMHKDTINRSFSADRRMGLVSGERVAFNGLIRDQTKLLKITAAPQADVAREEITYSDIYK